MKLLPQRGPAVPAPLRKLLEPHERTLAIADAPDSVLLATQFGLWLPTATPDDWRRLGWNQVVLATWTDDGLTIIEGEADSDGLITDLPAVRYSLSVPRNLPVVVRKRVEASIARWEQVRVPGGTARLIGRRVAGQDGLTWTARLDGNTPGGEAARAVLVAQLQRAVAAQAAQTAQALG
jgi:hypothetical protein